MKWNASVIPAKQKLAQKGDFLGVFDGMVLVVA
jgi:hypothetical protein